MGQSQRSRRSFLGMSCMGLLGAMLPGSMNPFVARAASGLRGKVKMTALRRVDFLK